MQQVANSRVIDDSGFIDNSVLIDNSVSANWLNIREKEMSLIIKIVRLLCDSKKSRMLSHCKSVFMNNIEAIQNRIIRENPPLFTNLKNTKYTCSFKYPLVGIEQNYESIIKSFIEALHVQDDLAFYWTKQILDTFKSSQKRLGSLKSELVIFDILLWFVKKRFVDDDDKGRILTAHIKVLLAWFKNPRLKFKEIRLTLYYAIMIVLKHDTIQLEQTSINDNIQIENGRCEDIYCINLSREKIVLDDYVVDIHTQKGRSKKKTKIDFASEGAFVENEDDMTVNDLYKRIYLDTKKWETSGEVSFVNSTTAPSSASTPSSVITPIGTQIPKANTKTVTQTQISIISHPKPSLKPDPKLPDIKFQQQTLSEDTIKTILTWPTAQKLTASWKGITYMGPLVVAKGPYDLKKQGDKGRLSRINRRQICNISTDTPNLPYIFVKEQNCSTNVWLISKQIALNDPKDWKPNDRSSCGVLRVSDMSVDTWKTNEQMVILLFKNALLNIATMQGDSGMHNQLAIPLSKTHILTENEIDFNKLIQPIQPRIQQPIQSLLQFSLHTTITALVQIDTEDLRLTQTLNATTDWKELMFIKNPKKELIASIEIGLTKFKKNILRELHRMIKIVNENSTLWGITSNGVLCAQRFVELIEKIT
jgi:hypothetical protein